MRVIPDTKHCMCAKCASDKALAKFSSANPNKEIMVAHTQNDDGIHLCVFSVNRKSLSDATIWTMKMWDTGSLTDDACSDTLKSISDAAMEII